MIEAIWITRAGLFFDIAGAFLVALDIFLTKWDWFWLETSNQSKFAGRMTDLMLRSGFFEVDWKEQSSQEVGFKSKLLLLFRDRDLLVCFIRLKMLKILEKGMQYYRKWGFWLILFGFLLQFVATFIN